MDIIMRQKDEKPSRWPADTHFDKTASLKQEREETPRSTNTSRKVLYIDMQDTLEHLVIKARTETETSTIDVDRGILSTLTDDLYQSIQHSFHLAATGEYLASELGGRLLGPFQGLIQSADEIVFVISVKLLRAPMDLLHHMGQPLFLQRPVSYRLSAGHPDDAVDAMPVSALIVSDVTADPERAAHDVASTFIGSTYRDVADVSLEFLREQREVDLLLMSVHGTIDQNGDGYVSLRGDNATVMDFSTIRPRLVYLDSCRLGVSGAFLRGFRDLGCIYYLAPIVSNEAGNSSTKTMQRFFRKLQQGLRAEEALFEARKELWRVYDDQEFEDRVWRAFPFRVYRLN